MSLVIERSGTVQHFVGLQERIELLDKARVELVAHVREVHPRTIPTSCHPCLNIRAVIQMQESSIRNFEA